ncbi:MAG TPA: glycoside hydrolase family 2 TIM barrel-domain containing protein [Trebonia sp.]|nr:glycoside hydrolase family 2 TIM barrel-domain containing protein [Trebonia sp.]
MTEPQVRSLVSRRVFLRTATAGTAGIAAWSLLSAGPARAATAGQSGEGKSSTSTQRGPASKIVPFSAGWLFGPESAGSDQPGFDDSQFATVTLPHTVTPLSWQNWNPATWEQVWSYRKHFDAPAGLDGLRVFLDFDAALTGSTLTLNGTQVASNAGGYLPFTAEVTGQLEKSGNVLAVTLDSTFNIDVPPDQPSPAASTAVDYWQPGGIYRDVNVRAVPQLFLADVFAQPVNVLDAAARQVSVQATVDAALVPSGTVTLAVELYDSDNSNKPAVSSATVPVEITATGQTAVTATLENLADITLWDTGNPKLYTVVATLYADGEPLHDYQVRIGFREASFELDGFYLNGTRTKLFGVNRHQFFPYAGGAMPDRVQARDAYILRKELNCNAVRGSHYPQSEAFYDAADELGLLCWQEIPGWGYFGDAAWAAAGYGDIGAMVVRGRNHPSVIVWGAMPNESGTHVAEYTLYNNLAHALDPSRPTGGDNTYTGTDYVFDVFSEHDYSSVTNAQGIRWPTLKAPADAAGKPYLICEAVGALSGPAIYYRRTDTQFVQQGQAIAHAIVQDISYSQDAYCGCLAWSGFDYPSGNGNEFQGVKYTGVVDLFRVPKPGAAVYQAQADPAVTPVIAPAFYWDFNPQSPVTSLSPALIASNLDELKVYVGGDLFATVTPDTADYGSLPYPPSNVDFSAVDGSALPGLRIDGYRGGVKVATRQFDADPARDRLELTADDAVIDADGSDATRVVFRAVDRYGNARPYVTDLVTLTVDGPAVLVSDNPVDFGATGGVAAAWIRSLPGSPGTVTVRAAHPTLGEAEVTIKIQQIYHGPGAVPYGTLSVTASPAFVTPGATTTVTAAFTNNGLLDLDEVSLAATIPDGWTATAGTPLTFRGVRSGSMVTATWAVALPSDANPGQSPVQVQAVYTSGSRAGAGGAQRGVTYQTIEVLSSYATLAAAFDNAGISDDSDITAADFDGVGNSYSAQALAAAGLAPGATVTHDGITFTWPDVQPGQPDNVVAQGQTILLSGSGTTLGVLGAGSPSESGSGTVYYTDGTTSGFSVTLDNYFDAPDGDDAVATLPYVNDSDGATAGDGGQPGQRQQTVYVFYTSAPLTAGKTVQAVTLPAGGIVPASGRISGMHIFALAIGPLNADGQPVT